MREPVDAGYRDALAAAHARVAQLEKRVAELEEHIAQSPERKAAFEQWTLEVERASARCAATERGARRASAIVATLFALASLVFTGLIASLGRAGHPLNAFILGVFVTLLATSATFLIGRVPVREARKRLADLERRQQAMLAGPSRIRVESASTSPVADDATIERDESMREGRAKLE